MHRSEIGLVDGTVSLDSATRDVPGRWTTHGRLNFRAQPSSVILGNGFCLNSECYGDAEFRFRARSPGTTDEVQIWAGFRARGPHFRYAVALRGGNNHHVYLARHAPEGGSRFLGIAPLETEVVSGQWYELRIRLAQRRIQVFLDDEIEPRLDVEDDDEGWTEGSVLLGGGYLPAEFAAVQIVPLHADGECARETPRRAAPQPAQQDKAALIRARRATYRPCEVTALTPGRTEVSLDGEWLFLPDQERPDDGFPAHPRFDDRAWHVLRVPDLWTPFLSWLHGETTFHEFDGVSAAKGVGDKVYLSEMARVEAYTFDWNATGVGWYRHHVELPAGITGKSVEICFDAVAKGCVVWFNGEKVGAHTGMFGEVRCDVSRFARPGSNVLAVQVTRRPTGLTEADETVVGIAESVEVTQSMISSLPTDMICHDPAGIWQPVTLSITDMVRLDEVFVQPSLDGLRMDLVVGGQPGAESGDIQVDYTIRSKDSGVELLRVIDAARLHPLTGDAAEISLDTPRLAPRVWHPADPYLYELEVCLLRRGALLDRVTTTFGFRTFRVSGNRFLLNDQPYWLRGANHFPHTLRPNDAALARRFLALAREGNVRVTRSHVAPLTKVWAEECDCSGMLVSFEGIWPWLMLKGEPPAPELLGVWKDDFISLVRKYRNHPSVVIWTVNNEMKFHHFDAGNRALLHKKWAVVDDAVRHIRRIDPTRPLVADSSYIRKRQQEDYEAVVRPGGFDDGDIDDIHEYFSWYHRSFTTTFDGGFANELASPDRPFICQELASGYARNDDGHPPRFYLFKHLTPQALVGEYAYDHQDPAFFLGRLAFVTKETAEALRRTNHRQAAGALHFSYLTWFKDVHDHRSITPWAPYHALKLGLQPVLVSAEWFGRHFFAGDLVSRRVCVVNDSEQTADIHAGPLEWAVSDVDGTVLSEGTHTLPTIPYYDSLWTTVDFAMPASVGGRTAVVLTLRLTRDGGNVLSENRYDLVVASREWARRPVQATGACCVMSPDASAELSALAAAFGLEEISQSAEGQVSAVDGAYLSSQQAGELRQQIEGGARVLLVNAGAALAAMLPEYVSAYLPIPTEIMSMYTPESAVFDGLEPMDLAWFELGSRQSQVCKGMFRVVRNRPELTVLAEACDYHNYLQKPQDIVACSGSPLFELRLGQGLLIVSEISLAAVEHDPVAARLHANMLARLERFGDEQETNSAPGARLMQEQTV